MGKVGRSTSPTNFKHSYPIAYKKHNTHSSHKKQIAMSSRRRRPVRSVLECTSAAGLNRQEVASDSSKASEDGGDLDTTGIENLPPQSQLDNDPGSTVLDRTGHGTHFPHRASAVKYQVNGNGYRWFEYISSPSLDRQMIAFVFYLYVDYVYLRPETLPEP